MKTSFYTALIALLLMKAIASPAQNLVLNGDLEAYTYPPTGSGLLLEDFVPGWFSYFTTPDYYNSLFMGDQGMIDYCGTLPHSGKGMVGAYVLGYFTAGYNREYLQGSLKDTLEAGKLYYAEMYVKPMLKAPVINFGIDKLGIAITDSHYDYADADSFLIDEEPDVENTSGIITALGEWTKISGCFRAKGGEYKIIIGNFRKDYETDTAQLPGAFGEETYKSGMSYFLFDDILVKEIPEAYILPADTVVCRDSFYVLSAYPENVRSYSWNTGEATQTITTNKYGAFTVKVVTNEGCVLEASATINTKFCGPVCPPLYMPNAFSPNNDGLNDDFAPANAMDMREVDFSIYNRFGQRVYSGHSLKSRWDGRYGDKPCDAGTYFYYSRYTDCHGADFTLKGDLTLIR